MAIHNKSHNNHALRSLNKLRKDNNFKQKTASDFTKPERISLSLNISDCLEYLSKLPDESVQRAQPAPRVRPAVRRGAFRSERRPQRRGAPGQL